MSKSTKLRLELSALQLAFLVTGKLLIGVGAGLAFASHIWYAQPYWFVWVLLGAIVLVPTLIGLLVVEKDAFVRVQKSR